jgi:outer membrane murein-binding lipoprotein Lpp
MSSSGSVSSDRIGIIAMDERMVEAIAQRAGLERALEAFPDDVAAAAVSAAKATERIRRSSGTPSEPWPPMAVVRK